MLALVVLILFGILIAIFATQNTNPVDITLANYRIFAIPTYFIALAGLLVGVVASWVLSFFGAISSFMHTRGKDATIHNLEGNVHDMEKKIRDLEVENARLRGEKNTDRPRFGFAGPTRTD